MDFFGSQDSRQKQSAILLSFFVLAMLAMALVVHVVAIVISMPVSTNVDFANPSKPAKAFIALIWLTCIVGCLFRILDVRAGGVALARRFGGIEAVGAGRYRKEQELLDIVAEIAVASGCDLPRTFILHREKSINAFVVGGFRAKEVIVISQGALQKLNREQLTAVVAHEFGHIAQGDIPLNMRLLIVLGGLNAIDEVGKLLMVRYEGKFAMQPGLVVGFVIRAIGSVGTLSGRLLRAAFSRQREYLADACAVQFTRMPEHLAAALAVIRDEHDEEGIHSVHAEELAHLCFQAGEMRQWHKRIFATHPPIQKRIDTIDPFIDTKQRARKRAENKASASLYSVGNGTKVVPLSTDEIRGGTAISDRTAMALTDVSSCLAVLHAIFVSPDSAKSKLYYKAIAFAYNKLFASQVREMQDTLGHDLQTNQLAVIEQATAQIRDSIKLENRQRLLKSLEKLLLVEGEFTLINYATLQLIRRKLDAEFPILEQVAKTSTAASGTNVKTFDTMGQEFALLLSLIVEASGNSSATQEQQFQLALKCYTKDYHPRRSGDEKGIVKELEASFQTLYVQPRPIREAFVKHCLEIAQADGHIARDERAMLDLFAASLKCDLMAA